MLINITEVKVGDEIITPKHREGRVVEAIFDNGVDAIKITYVTGETEWFSKQSTVFRKSVRS